MRWNILRIATLVVLVVGGLEGCSTGGPAEPRVTNGPAEPSPVLALHQPRQMQANRKLSIYQRVARNRHPFVDGLVDSRTMKMSRHPLCWCATLQRLLSNLTGLKFSIEVTA